MLPTLNENECRGLQVQKTLINNGLQKSVVNQHFLNENLVQKMIFMSLSQYWLHLDFLLV